jgi:hypothetical protein
MDFSTLNTKDGAEQGAFLHLCHTVTGALLYDANKNPIGVYLRGNESDTVQTAVRQFNRATVKGGQTKEFLNIDLASLLVIRFVGVMRGDRPLTTSAEDLRWFFGLSDNLVEQVLEFSKERGNFFGQPSPAVSSPPSK